MFQFKPSSVIRDNRQRLLFDRWESRRGHRCLPSLRDIDPDTLAEYWADIILYNVERGPPGRRYRIAMHGESMAQVNGPDLVGQYLDAYVPPALREGFLAAYDATVVNRRPVYTVRDSIDRVNNPVTFERLVLPVSDDSQQVDAVITHFVLRSPAPRIEKDRLLHHGLAHREYALKAVIASPSPAPCPRQPPIL